MARQSLSLGNVPIDEPCLQVGDVPLSALLAEVKCYLDYLERHFQPKHTTLGIKKESHDFGTYYDVVVYYDEFDEVAEAEALEMENSPLNWDEKSKAEIQRIYQEYEVTPK